MVLQKLCCSTVVSINQRVLYIISFHAMRISCCANVQPDKHVTPIVNPDMSRMVWNIRGSRDVLKCWWEYGDARSILHKHIYMLTVGATMKRNATKKQNGRQAKIMTWGRPTSEAQWRCYSKGYRTDIVQKTTNASVGAVASLSAVLCDLLGWIICYATIWATMPQLPLPMPFAPTACTWNT